MNLFTLKAKYEDTYMNTKKLAGFQRRITFSTY